MELYAAFTLNTREQFGPQGPTAGDKGVATSSMVVPDEDVLWYRCLFKGFEGNYLLPEYMMEFESN